MTDRMGKMSGFEGLQKAMRSMLYAAYYSVEQGMTTYVVVSPDGDVHSTAEPEPVDRVLVKYDIPEEQAHEVMALTGFLQERKKNDLVMSGLEQLARVKIGVFED